MKFIERNTAPGKDNKYYYGNINPFNPTYGLPNCTCYGFGRWYEILDERPNLCLNQAEIWYTHKDNYKRGNTPKLGAIACWSKGSPENWKDGSGHIAVVERINDDGSFVSSESAWQGYLFRNNTYKGNYNFGAYKFQGFIYLPIEFDSPTKSVEEIAKEVLNGKWGNGVDRKNRLEAAGYNYNTIQNKVNELCKPKPTLKSVDTIAKEVINGKWGNGTDRRNRLTNAGYNYNEVQARVNQLLK